MDNEEINEALLEGSTVLDKAMLQILMAKAGAVEQLVPVRDGDELKYRIAAEMLSLIGATVGAMNAVVAELDDIGLVPKLEQMRELQSKALADIERYRALSDAEFDTPIGPASQKSIRQRAYERAAQEEQFALMRQKLTVATEYAKRTGGEVVEPLPGAVGVRQKRLDDLPAITPKVEVLSS